MNQITTIINKQKLFKDFFKPNEFHNSEDSFELHGKWPDGIGNGFMYGITFRPGFVLGIGDYQLRENLILNFEVKSSAFVHIGFGISGSVWFAPIYGQDKKDDSILNSGQSFISYRPEWRGIAKYPARTPVRVVSIYIDPRFLNTLVEGQDDQILAGVRDILGGADEKYCYHPSSTTPAMNVAIHQILNCPYRGVLKRLYLESKALELTVHKLAQVVSPECGVKNSSALRPDDIERIHEARDILIRDVENPPSLLELARQVGVNEKKLNLGFRQVFGTTVFDYLRTYRLEKAKQLLNEGKMNVTEVAFGVGYLHHSTFSRSFARHFGISPMAYRLERRLSSL